MFRFTSATAALIAAGVLLPAAAAAGSTSHVSVWQNKKKSVQCGIEASALSKKKILCSAKGIPRPRHSNPNVGDPFVELAGSGKAKLVLISQNSFPSGAKTTHAGQWRKVEQARRDLHAGREDRDVQERRASRLHDRQRSLQVVLSEVHLAGVERQAAPVGGGHQ